MSQDFERDRDRFHSHPNGDEYSEQRLNKEEILQDSKTDYAVVSMIRGLHDRFGNNGLLQPYWERLTHALAFLFLVFWYELCGAACNGKVRYWAKILSLLAMGVMPINIVIAWPFFARSLGVIEGIAVLAAIALLTNLAMKLTCHRPRPGNCLMMTGLIGSLILAIVITIPAPIAQIQAEFGSDLSKQHAYTIKEDYAFAPEQSKLEAIMATESQVREVKRECARLKAEIQSNKEKKLPYDNLSLEAEGKWIEDYQTDKRWEDIPVENRPICPKSRALERQFNADKEKSEEALRLVRSELKSVYGDNYLEALRQEQSHLYEMYFDKSGRIRSPQQELAEAIRFMFSSNAGVKVMISVPTILSVLASALLFTMTYFYISDPAVQRSWNSRAALNQRNRIRRTFDGGNGNGQ
ncbi:MAG: hypothetical protein AAF544_08580 [Bacteroidota bacterium]